MDPARRRICSCSALEARQRRLWGFRDDFGLLKPLHLHSYTHRLQVVAEQNPPIIFQEARWVDSRPGCPGVSNRSCAHAQVPADWPSQCLGSLPWSGPQHSCLGLPLYQHPACDSQWQAFLLLTSGVLMAGPSSWHPRRSVVGLQIIRGLIWSLDRDSATPVCPGTKRQVSFVPWLEPRLHDPARWTARSWGGQRNSFLPALLAHLVVAVSSGAEENRPATQRNKAKTIKIDVRATFVSTLFPQDSAL